MVGTLDTGLLTGDMVPVAVAETTYKNQARSFHGDGDFWVVKSPTALQIHHRLSGPYCTKGLAATPHFVVGGPFSCGNKIEVGTLVSGVPNALTRTRPSAPSASGTFGWCEIDSANPGPFLGFKVH